jgi:uncharacterized protein YjbI with pentapeptide repeats
MVDRVDGRPPAPTDTRIDREDWYEQDLTGREYERVLFQDLDMTDSTGSRVRFVDCTLRGARFDRCRLDASSCDLRGSDLGSLDPRSVELRRAIVDWQQAAVIAANLGLDVRLQ